MKLHEDFLPLVLRHHLDGVAVYDEIEEPVLDFDLKAFSCEGFEHFGYAVTTTPASKLFRQFI